MHTLVKQGVAAIKQIDLAVTSHNQGDKGSHGGDGGERDLDHDELLVIASTMC